MVCYQNAFHFSSTGVAFTVTSIFSGSLAVKFTASPSKEKSTIITFLGQALHYTLYSFITDYISWPSPQYRILRYSWWWFRWCLLLSSKRESSLRDNSWTKLVKYAGSPISTNISLTRFQLAIRYQYGTAPARIYQRWVIVFDRWLSPSPTPCIQ